MTETITRTYALPLSPSAFWETISSRDQVERRCAADGMGSRLAEHKSSTDVVRIVVATEVPLDWLPGPVTARLGGSTPVVERMEEWLRDGDGARSPLTFSFAGLPVSCTGQARLTAAGGGSRFDVALELRVNVPLFGGMVERGVSPRIAAALDAEAEFYQGRAG